MGVLINGAEELGCQCNTNTGAWACCEVGPHLTLLNEGVYSRLEAKIDLCDFLLQNTTAQSSWLGAPLLELKSVAIIHTDKSIVLLTSRVWVCDAKIR